ncbi:MAG: PQQ-dependent sugar dehydrogenase, partial [Gemmataceae bacterium]
GNTGQDLRDLTSGIVRIDVDRPAPGQAYSIPRDNPFLHLKEARGELWAFGLRNPWRIHFDGPDLYIGDVGQDLREMVYLGRRGANYGWSIREGTASFHPHRTKGPGDFVDPLIEHPHSESRSLTGGLVYRGKRFPELVGTYLYGDYSTGRIWGLRHKDGKLTYRATLADTRLRVIGFGTDTAGEVYILCHGGQLHTLEKAENRPDPATFPRTLLATGLFMADGRPHPSLIPYTINAPLWSDGSEKERWMVLPFGASIRFHEKEPWKFPNGTIFVKTFSIDTPEGRRKIETRLLVQDRGEWAGYSYAWNEAQTDALLVEADGRDATYRQVFAGETRDLKWHYPSRIECMVCHTRAAGFVLGMSTAQANRGGQLQRWSKSGLLRLPQSEKALPQLTDYTDSNAAIEDRARSYLHGNCAHCHVWAGGGNSAINLHANTPREQMKLINVEPLHDKFGIKDARLIAPGDPMRSVLYARLTQRGRGQMPPLATHHSDPLGAQLIRQWIESLQTDSP